MRKRGENTKHKPLTMKKKKKINNFDYIKLRPSIPWWEGGWITKTSHKLGEDFSTGKSCMGFITIAYKEHLQLNKKNKPSSRKVGKGHEWTFHQE